MNDNLLRRVHGSRFTHSVNSVHAVHGLKKTVNCQLSTVYTEESRGVNCFKRGFSLIEVIVVIALFAITSIVVTTSYIGFEGRERLKNGALQLKGDIRFVQSKAQSGDKGLGNCGALSSLAGWYITLDTTAGSNSSYTIAGDCFTSPNEVSFSPTTMKLPQGVTITSLAYGADLTTPKSILFRPTDYLASFHTASATPTTPPINFLDSTGLLINTLPAASEMVITLSNSDGTYEVRINNSGKIYENRP